MDDAPETLDPAALAARLHVAGRTLRAWVKAGVVPPAHGDPARFDRAAIVRAHAVAALRREGIAIPQIKRFLAKKSELELREIGGLPPPRPSPAPRALPANASASSEPPRPPSEAEIVARGAVPDPDALSVQGPLASRDEPAGAGVPVGSAWRRIELLPGLELHVRADAPPFVHGIAAAIAAGRFTR